MHQPRQYILPLWLCIATMACKFYQVRMKQPITCPEEGFPVLDPKSQIEHKMFQYTHHSQYNPLISTSHSTCSNSQTTGSKFTGRRPDISFKSHKGIGCFTYQLPLHACHLLGRGPCAGNELQPAKPKYKVEVARSSFACTRSPASCLWKQGTYQRKVCGTSTQKCRNRFHLASVSYMAFKKLQALQGNSILMICRWDTEGKAVMDNSNPLKHVILQRKLQHAHVPRIKPRRLSPVENTVIWITFRKKILPVVFHNNILWTEKQVNFQSENRSAICMLDTLFVFGKTLVSWTIATQP